MHVLRLPPCAQARADREEKGIELGEGDPIFGTDFDHVLRRELRRLLPDPIIWIEVSYAA